MSAVAVVFSEGTSRLLLNRCIFYRLMFKDVYATATIAAISIISAVYMNMSAVFNHNVWAYCTPLEPMNRAGMSVQAAAQHFQRLYMLCALQAHC